MPDAPAAAIAADFGVAVADREQWLRAAVLRVDFDEQARIAAVAVVREQDRGPAQPA